MEEIVEIATKKVKKVLLEGKTEKEKEKIIKKGTKILEKYFDVLFEGWRDNPNMKDTPGRVTKAYIQDLCKSLYNPMPKMTDFKNTEKFSNLILQANIPVQSLCSHHLQNIYGVAHVAYIPSPDGNIIGLSKLNRIVEYYSRQPQVQENLTQQIYNAVDKICTGNQGVAVIITAKHMCVSHRGINQNSDMSTPKLSGEFLTNYRVRNELYALIQNCSKS